MLPTQTQPTVSNLEYTPCDLIAFYTIGHVLYGDNKQDLYGRLNTAELCDRMQTESVDYCCFSVHL